MVLVVAAGLVATMPFGPIKTTIRTAALASLIQTVLTIYVTPSNSLRGGEQVFVNVRAAFWSDRLIRSGFNHVPGTGNCCDDANSCESAWNAGSCC